MAVASQVKPITVEILTSLGEDAIVEVVGGELIEMTPAGARHGRITVNLVYALESAARAGNLGHVFSDQTAYVLRGTPDDIQTMRLPDVSFIRAERLPDQTPEGYWFLAPDLAVEVISPTERAAYTQVKLKDYFDAGTREVWVVYPDTRQVVVHWADGSRVYSADDTLTRPELLPGFEVKIAELFE
jgi:Uma2 family endonuclease